MMNPSPVRIPRLAALSVLLVLGGCAVFRPVQPPPPPPQPPPPPKLEQPLATHVFAFEPGVAVVGELQVTHSRKEDTFADIARRFDLGYDELLRANPGIDPWLPGEGTEIVLPTQFVLPDGPRDGLVVNVAAMRMFWFPKAPKGQPRVVVTYPIGIGKVGWATPIGSTKVVSKRKGPIWTPPESVRREHAKAGDPLPARVPPGPDNPLGAYAMNLGWPSYLIHGTNKPPGVGMRASHGCIRLYPEDIAALFPEVPVGTRVTVVNQPLLSGWQSGNLYVQAFPVPVEGEDDSKAPTPLAWDAKVAASLDSQAGQHDAAVDAALAQSVITQSRGITTPVTRGGLTPESWIAGARRVLNVLPEGSNWDGTDGSVATPVASGR